MTGPGDRAIVGVVEAVAAHLPDFLPKQRWFGGKGRAIERVEIRDQAALVERPSALLLMVDVVGPGQETATYFLPVAIEAATPDSPVVEPIVRLDGVAVYDGLIDPLACRAVLQGIVTGGTTSTDRGGRFAFRATAPRPGEGRAPLDTVDVGGLPVRRLSVEQSNSSVIFGESLILKAFRRTQAGMNPEVEILRFLGEHTTFDHVPRLLGWAEYESPDGTSMPVGVLQAFVPNEGDGWDWTLRTVGHWTLDVGRADDPSRHTSNVELQTALGSLGKTLADLHLALASRPDLPEVAPEPITRADVEGWHGRTLASLGEALRHIETGLAAPSGRSGWPAELRPAAEAVQAGAGALRDAIDRLGLLADGRTVKTRHHGDFHLGQTLVGPDGWTIIDFEGEPLRSLAERRAKHTPLRDVAGLLRSLDYAEVTLARQRAAETGATASADRDPALAGTFAEARRAFLDAYTSTIRAAGAPLLPRQDDALAYVLRALEVEKALYELGYEVGNRPDWVAIPLSALARLTAS